MRFGRLRLWRTKATSSSHSSWRVDEGEGEGEVPPAVLAEDEGEGEGLAHSSIKSMSNWNSSLRIYFRP